VIVHGGLVAARVAGGWRGALIEGESGVGKSDLALRCLSQGFRLVADDRVLLWVSGGGLFGRAPDALAGLLEMRGLGVRPISRLDFAAVRLVVSCGTPDRMPEPAMDTRMGLALPRLILSPLEASAPAKLSHALEHLGGDA
jgi:hypothetical protein